MPTYEYLCQTCSHRFETWQRMADEPLTVCPECGNHIRRVLYPAGVVFKGSGFYKTDSAQAKAAAIPPGHSSEGNTKTNGEQKSTESGKNGEGSKGGESSSSKPESGSSSSTTATTAAK